MPVRNCSVIRKRAVVPNAYIQAPLFGAGWSRKRASDETRPLRSSTQPATNRPASAVRDPILPIALIASTSSPAQWSLRRPSLGLAAIGVRTRVRPGVRHHGHPGVYRSPNGVLPGRSPHLVSEELLPGPLTHSAFGRQIRASPVRAGSLAREPERQDRPTPPLTGP